MLLQRLCQFLMALLLGSLALVGLYAFIAAPPMQYFYEKAPSAGPNSVYVPGAGFAGFWYHLGLFHGIFTAGAADRCTTDEDSSKAFHIDSEYYCYSSGCLSLLLAIMDLDGGDSSAHLDFVYDLARDTQTSWQNGEINHFEIVERFLQKTILDPIVSGEADEEHLLALLPNFNILITTGTDGVQIKKAENLVDLVNLLIQTTWIPFVTGDGIGKIMHEPTTNVSTSASILKDGISTMQQPIQKDWFLDGGFSRRLHPVCEHVVSVPINWKTTIHSLNPGMSREACMDLYQMGMEDSQSFLQSKCGRVHSDVEFSNDGESQAIVQSLIYSSTRSVNMLLRNFISAE